MTKRKDEEADALAKLLESDGWKKYAYLHYRFMDTDKRFLVSITLRRKHINDKRNVLVAALELHSVLLNEWCSYVYSYADKGNMDKGLFKGRKLKPTENLMRVNNCMLFRTHKVIPVDLENMASFVSQLDGEAQLMYEKYSDLDALIEAHDQPNKGKEAAMIMYLTKGNYQRVRELLQEYDPYPPVGGGDVRLGLWTYLSENNLI